MPQGEELQNMVILLEGKTQASRRNARKNYRMAFFCHGLAIATSLAATIVAAASALPGSVIAIVTAIPGTSLLLNSIFSFDKKALWHRRKKHRYEALLMGVRFESLPIAEASKSLAIFEEEMEKEYPSFGTFPKKTS